MDITQVSTTQGGDLEPAAVPWLVAFPVEVAPAVTLYRRDLYLRFATGGAAHRLVIDTAAVAFKGTLQPYTYDVLSSEATVHDAGALLHVTLPAPRTICQVTFTGLAGFGANLVMELYRIDGNTPTEKPTVTASIASHEATLAVTGNAAFMSNRFAIGVRKGDQTLAPLHAGNIVHIDVCSYPTTPRIGLAAPEPTASVAFFWIAPGEIGREDGTASLASVTLGEKLADELERYMQTLTASLPEPPNGLLPLLPEAIDVRLVIESDAPCSFDMTLPAGEHAAESMFNVSYHLAREAFGMSREKQSLKFPGAEVVTQEVAVDVPGNAAVIAATMEVTESFRRDRAASSQGLEPGNGHGPALADEMLSQKNGIHVGVEHWIGREITLNTATAVSGLALGAMALSAGTALLIELQEGWQGRPSGKTLASGTLPLPNTGQSAWGTLAFATPVALSSQPYWLLAKAANGHAVWLADADAASTQVLTRPAATGVWQQVNIVQGFLPVSRLLSRSADAVRDQPPVILALGGDALQQIDHAEARPGAQSYDLTACLQNALKDHPQSPELVTVRLGFSSAVKGFLTVYAPVIVYDLKG